MPITIQRRANGSYYIYHRPIQRANNSARLEGPVFRREDRVSSEYGRHEVKRRLLYVREGLGDTCWIIFTRDYLTGKQTRYTRSAVHSDRQSAVGELRALAARHGWRDVGEIGDADFVCGR